MCDVCVCVGGGGEGGVFASAHEVDHKGVDTEYLQPIGVTLGCKPSMGSPDHGGISGLLKIVTHDDGLTVLLTCCYPIKLMSLPIDNLRSPPDTGKIYHEEHRALSRMETGSLGGS